jgi:hypothetical protein
LTYLQDDPVHLTKEGYAALLKEILARTDDGTYTRVQRSGAAGHTINPNRGHLNNPSIFKRKAWVDTDDTKAHRDYGWSSRGASRGARSPWGGKPFRGAGRGFRGAGSAGQRGPRTRGTAAGPTELDNKNVLVL